MKFRVATFMILLGPEREDQPFGMRSVFDQRCGIPWRRRGISGQVPTTRGHHHTTAKHHRVVSLDLDSYRANDGSPRYNACGPQKCVSGEKLLLMMFLLNSVGRLFKSLYLHCSCQPKDGSDSDTQSHRYMPYTPLILSSLDSPSSVNRHVHVSTPGVVALWNYWPTNGLRTTRL
ncbi:hypothetical protein EI94DRAFT_1714354, partial [Lactarius quietus]